jgi:hypothetical protein
MGKKNLDPRATRYTLRVQLGRTDDVVGVDDLDDATLIDLAVKKVKKCNGVDDCGQRSTQVLIWDNNGREHNLIAVYGIRDCKLTVL